MWAHPLESSLGGQGGGTDQVNGIACAQLGWAVGSLPLHPREMASEAPPAPTHVKGSGRADVPGQRGWSSKGPWDRVETMPAVHR